MNNQFDLNFRQSENIFRTLIEESLTPVGLYVGPDMIIKVANKAIIKIFGKGDNVLNKLYFDVLPELKEQSIYNILNNVYTTGIAYEATEDRIDLVVDGELKKFYFNFSFKPLLSEDGNVWGVLNTAADVTELVLIRQQLAESEERTQFALNAAVLGTWEFDPVNKTLVWDERCQELFGFKKDDPIKYDDVSNCIHPDDVDYVNKKVLESVDSKKRKPYDIKYRTVGIANEQQRWVRAKGRAYFNDEGICFRFAGTMQDITREVDDSEQQKRLITLIDNTAEVIGVTTLDAQVTYLNKAGYEMLGIEKYEDAFRPAAEYFIPFDTKMMAKKATDSIVNTGKWEGERYYKHFKTGETIPIHLNAFRIDDPITGKPIAMASVARDLRPEREARNEQTKLLALIDNSSDFVSLGDINNNITYINASGRRMLGIEENDNIFKPGGEYAMPADQDTVQKIYKSLRETGSWSGEVNYRHFKTGEPIPVFANTMMVYDSVTGKSLGRATIARDLRREIADKKALIESERLLQNITGAAPTALWMSDHEGNITYANRTWTDWTGYTNKEIMGRGWLSAIVPDDRQQAAEKFIADLSARKPYEVSFRITNKHGDIRWCVATGNPQYNSDGIFVGYIGACTDVTEKTLAEQQLHLKNEELNDQINQFEFVTAFMPVQLWTATINGDLDYINQRTLDFFGTGREKIIGPEWILHVHPDDRDGCIATWTHSLQTGDTYQFEFRLKDKNGNYKWHLARALPFISDGKIVKWFGTNTDIDEQIQLQRQKDDFLGIASHELKTPVTSIKAYTQVLGAMLTQEGDQKKAEMVVRMDAQVNRLTNLIGDLLDVTKINSGRLQFNKVWFNVNEAINETVADLQHTTLKHQLKARLQEIGDIFSDKDRISQVLTNLITNAIKYSPNSEEIIITTELRNNEIIICVRDFGIGIPADKTDRVFEQFYRVSGEMQHTFPGLGLGLYISSEIVKREGGRMWVNSIEGKGSDFCFALPVNYNQTETN
jgi:PAS domain S-box-containing protein